MFLKRISIFLMCGVLILCPVLTLYADSIDWKTSDFTFEYDGVKFHHHSDGTCDVINADGTINQTMTKDFTEKAFKAWKIEFDSAGNISTSANDSMQQQLFKGIAAIAGSVSSWFSTDDIAKDVYNSIYNEHTVTQAYFTNSFADGVTVDSNGNINLTSDKVDELIKLMKKQYREYVGLYEAADFTHDGTKTDIILFLTEKCGFNNTQVNHILDWFEQNGYDSIYFGKSENGYVSSYQMEIWGFNTSAYAYAYSYDSAPYSSGGEDVKYLDSNLDEIDKDNNPVGGYIAAKDITAGNMNNLESIFHVRNLAVINYLGEYNLFSYDKEPWYWKFYHLKDTANFKYYTSYEKLLNHVNGNTNETFYYTNDFVPGAHPDGITITTDMLSEDWEKHNQDIIDAIEKGIDGITDAAERQEKINTIINNYLQKINDSISDINDTVEQANKKTNSLLREILQAIQDFNSDFNSFIKTSDTQILNDIKNNLTNLTNTVKDLAKDVSKIKTLNELQLAIQALDLVDLDGLKIEINTDFQLCADKIKTKFPTCALFDIAVVANMLSAEPAAPVVQYKFTIASAGIEYPVNIDFSILDNYIEYFRGAQVILFILSLIKFTISLFVKGGDF